tara:strand:+ start:328 stop:585 length:258 start_codon:yes stop_codon:yes gene_type:complete
MHFCLYVGFFSGKNSKIKCRREASAPKLSHFIETLERFGERIPRKIQVVTDDLQIHKEIERVSNDRYNFLTAEPAPIRFPDKVSC